MNEIKKLLNNEELNKKMNEKPKNIIEIRKIIPIKFRPELINNTKQLKRSKENKISQTMIKKYSYNLNNNLVKYINLTDYLNSINSLKNTPTKAFLYSKIRKMIQDKTKENKEKHTPFKKAESSKIYFKPNQYQKIFKSNSQYKRIIINKKILNKKKTIASKTSNKNLENIDTNYFNSLVEKKMNSTSNFQTKNIKYKLIDNNSTSSIKDKIVNRNQSAKKIDHKINKEPNQLNKRLILRNSIFKEKQPNQMILRNNLNNLYYSEKKNESVSIWKNKILNDLITNIQSTSNIDLNLTRIKEKKFLNNSNNFQKIRISTLMNIYNKNLFNSHSHDFSM